MTASSTCAVQMLLVALVAADVLLAGLQREAVGGACPWLSRDTPTMRPGMLRLWASGWRRTPRAGPP
jgi:hypothetical protein